MNSPAFGIFGGWSLRRAAWSGLTGRAGRTGRLRANRRTDRVWHLAADDSRDAVALLDWHLARDATSPRFHSGVRHLLADRVRHFASPRLGRRRAGRVWHLLRVALLRPRTGDIRHLASAAFLASRASRVRHFASAGLGRHRASRVRDSAGASLLSHRAGRVRHLASTCLRHCAADLVRDAAGPSLWNPTRVADRLLDRFRAPDFAAADGRRALHLNGAAAAGLVRAAASAGILAPGSGILHALVHDRPGDALADRLPFAAANIDVLRLGAGATDGVADVFVASLGHDFAGRVALVAPARLRDRLTDGVADISVTRLSDRLANVVALVTPAGLHARDADGVVLVAVARLIARHADRTGFVAPAGLSDRAADGVALVPIAGLVASARAADRHLLALLIVDGLIADLFATIPYDVLDRLVAGRALLLSLAKIATRSTGGSRAAVVAGRSAISGLGELRR